MVIPPGYASAAFIFTSQYGTGPFVTTLGLDISNVAGQFLSVADRAMATYGTYVMPLIHNELVLDRVTLSIGQDGPGGSVDSTLAAITGGRSTSDDQVAAMAPIMRKVTNEFGRRGRGRMFIPGALTDGDTAPDGTVSAARQSALNAAFQDVHNSLIAEPVEFPVGIPPVLFHSTAPTVPTPVEQFVCSELVGWIRGRIR